MEKYLIVFIFCLLSSSFASASEGLENIEINRVVKVNLKYVRHCFEKLLQVDSKAHGKLKVNFTIAPTGLVSKVSVVEDTVGDTAFAECVSEKIMRWKFPAPRDGKDFIVIYPFKFNLD